MSIHEFVGRGLRWAVRQGARLPIPVVVRSRSFATDWEVAALCRAHAHETGDHSRMSKRRSFDVEGLGHANPIPAASRIGNLVVTGGISGADAKTGKMPEVVGAQCTNMFANLRTILAAAGATPEDVIRVTVWIKRPEIRTEVNKFWVEMFRDPHSSPARHTMIYDHFAGDMVVQCEAWAVVGESRAAQPL